MCTLLSWLTKLTESEKKDKYLDLARGTEKNFEHESEVYANCNWCSWYSHLGNHLGNTEKSRGDLRRLAVTQIAVKKLQLTLMRKLLKE